MIESSWYTSNRDDNLIASLSNFFSFRFVFCKKNWRMLKSYISKHHQKSYFINNKNDSKQTKNENLMIHTFWKVTIALKCFQNDGISNIRWILFKNVLKRYIHYWSAWKMVTVGKFNTWTKYKLYNTDEYRLIMYIKNIEERRIQPIVSADKS